MSGGHLIVVGCLNLRLSITYVIRMMVTCIVSHLSKTLICLKGKPSIKLIYNFTQILETIPYAGVEPSMAKELM